MSAPFDHQAAPEQPWPPPGDWPADPAGPAGSAGPAVAAPAAAPRAGGFLTFWTNPVVIAGVMGTILLLVTALAIVAIRGVGARSGAGTGADPDEARPAAVDTSAAAGPGATTPGSTPSRAGAASSKAPTFLNGRMQLYEHQGDVDFDAAKSG
jgi:hypothetical protein